ncbi:MAG: 50S ribosomal protein L28 [Nitrospinota bacterium]|jgi:large subunit ribosomal protein L28|nr:50S ribosomal protein L28 [Nitrospinota bacterium]MDP7166768.1 50S ribosomal protein L28 [Nitrospinota bacterium]MDP7370037.1 50S ribosomal protein L28 [Nitrospinota bacterium]MDP7663968.1 50S ribosomal protein L28 [Nitrospinota bacterium]HJP14865.1 50S ribosomal protein L28 [Nitrospinota bacterium]|tara:strand:+ start:255 stop:521 length:267 start_codon:yes stop_codon:yes gene_type:complete
MPPRGKTISIARRRCIVTGKAVVYGNTVSHSHRKSPRRFEPNLHRKRIWVPEEKRYVTLLVSARGLKTIAKKGIFAVLSDLRRKGEKV